MRDIRPLPPKKKPPGGESHVPKRERKAPHSRWQGEEVPVAAVQVDDALPPSSQSTAKPQRRPMRLGNRERVAVASLLGLGVIVVVLAILIFLPKAEIVLQLRTAPLLVDEAVVIAAEGAGQAQVPGSMFFREITVEEVAPVAGTEVVGEKAQGSVTLVNRTFDAQPIKEESRLVTAEGLLYYMQRSATIPAATEGVPGTVSVSVEAAEAGEAYNIPQDTRLDFAALDESSQTLVYADSGTLTGGSGETVSIVTEEDIATARKAAQESIRTIVEPEIRDELPEGWTLLDEGWEVTLDSFEPGAEAGSQAAQLPYTARGTARVMGYEQSALENHLRAALEGQLDEEFQLFPGPISYTKSVESVDWETGTAELQVRITHTTIPDFSLTTLREKIAGQREAEVRTYLEGLPGVQEVQLTLSPFWVRSVPRIERRVEIDLQSERQP